MFTYSPQNQKNTKNRELWPDAIRVVAAFFVVMIHCGASPHDSCANNTATILATIAKPAVIWFFMLSGSLLLGKQETLGQFFQKRLLKVMLPLAAFSLLFLIIGDKSLPNNKDEIQHALTRGVHFHLWFLHSLIVCYCAVPVLRLVVSHSTQTVIYVFILWLFFARWMPIQNRILGVSESVFPNAFGYLSLHGGYLLLGWYLARTPLSKRFQPWALLMWLASSILSVIAHTAGNPWNTFGLGYTSPLLMASASFGFLCMRQFSESARVSKWLEWATRLAPLSFGIYLIHPIFTASIPWLASNDAGWCIIFRTLLIFSISAITVYAARRFRIGRLIMP